MKRLRLAILLGLLGGVSLWALALHHRRAARTRWHKPLEVAVILLGEKPDGWENGLRDLERWIGAEMGRYRRVIDDPPVRFHSYGPVAAEAPQFLPPDDALFTRVGHAWRLSRALAKLDAQAGLYDPRGHAVADDGLSPEEKGRFAEIMVGEIAPGRLPRSLDEVRVGRLTARALHWSLTSTVR